MLAGQPLVGFLRHVVGRPGLLVELGGGVGDVLHHDVDALDEGVDVLGDGTDLIFTLDLDATGEIAVAAGEIGNCLAQGFQRRQGAVDGDIGEARHDEDGQQSLNEGGGDHAGDGLVGDRFVHHDAEIPVGVGDLGEFEYARLAADIHLGDGVVMSQLVDLGCRQFRGDGGGGFEGQILVRVGDDGAVAVHQNGIGAFRVHGEHVFHQTVDGDVTGDDAVGVAATEGLGDGDDELARGDVGVRGRDGELAGGHGVLVPGALARVIAGRQIGGLALDHPAILGTHVDEIEVARIHGLGQVAEGLVFLGEGFLGGGDEIDAGVEPAGDPLDVGDRVVVDEAPDQPLGFTAQLGGVVPDLQAGDDQNDGPDGEDQLVLDG